MKRHFLICLRVVFYLLAAGHEAVAQEKAVYNRSEYIHNWNTPDWASAKKDHIGPVLSIDENFTKDGDTSSLRLNINFSGHGWSAGIVETEGVFDLTLYKSIAFDVYLPKKAPEGMGVRVIIVSGDQFEWIEMIDAVRVEAGRRNTVRANLKQGSREWKTGSEVVEISDDIKESVKKIGIRVESNNIRYNGPIYIDNIKMEK